MTPTPTKHQEAIDITLALTPVQNKAADRL